MPSNYTEEIVNFAEGINKYAPPLAALGGQFDYLYGFLPKKGRLVAFDGYVPIGGEQGDGGIWTLGFFVYPNDQFTVPYAFSRSQVLIGSGSGQTWFFCRVLAEGHITLAGFQTLDGVTVVDGDIVLAKGQNNPVDNGAYVVAAGAWPRASFLANGSSLGDTAFIVTEGILRANVQQRPAPGSGNIIGSDPIFFAEASETWAVLQGGFNFPDYPMALVPDFDGLFFSCLGQPIKKLRGKVILDVNTEYAEGSGLLSARYGIVANGHAFWANIQVGASRYPTRFGWSNLNSFEDYVIQVGSDADTFALEIQDLEITGLSYQRGAVIIYSKTAIWRGDYVGQPEIYRFEPIYNGVGCRFHHSVVTIKEVDFFWGSDNIYQLDGLQLTVIGDEVWDYIKTQLFTGLGNQVIRGYTRPQENEVSWTFKNHYDDPLEVVFNYKERKWSFRHSQFVTANLPFVNLAETFIPIDSVPPDVIDSPIYSNLTIDGEWQKLHLNSEEILGNKTGDLVRIREDFKFPYPNPITLEILTYEMHFGSLRNTKTLDQVKLLYKGFGQPVIRCRIGARNHTGEDIVWSPFLSLAGQLRDDAKFFFRTYGVGKLLTVHFLVDNSLGNCVTEIYGVSYMIQGIKQAENAER